jgi:DNA-binding beta-propeller fold protein YncE
MLHSTIGTLRFAVLCFCGWLGVAEADVLELETKIPLGEVYGRIDHMAVDLNHERLYVAELGNDSLGVIDLKRRKILRTILYLREPQGIGYVPSSDTLYVANGGDGVVRLYHGPDLTPAKEITLGDDADNVRVDDQAHRVYVGYGTGALAVIDTDARAKIADIPLKAHPESFRLEQGTGQRIFVNLPDAREIAVVDRATNKQVASWQTSGLRWNFPLALDDSGHVLTVFRQPARLAVFRVQDGKLLSSMPVCNDSDDVFLDAKRHRVYVSCGQGFVDVFSGEGEKYAKVLHLATVPGARTALFVPEVDRLFLAVRQTGDTPAAVWVYRPGD